jgi:type IV pilus assembly protein PilA
MNGFRKGSFVTQKGFTLIELMIVVAIVGILAAIAMPSYQNYTAKAQSSEGVMLAEGVKRDVELVHAMDKTCPGNGESGIGAADSINGKYVASVTTGGTVSNTGGCTVVAAFKSTGVSAKIASATISWTLVAGEHTSQWNCATSLNATLSPKGCTASVASNSTGGATGGATGGGAGGTSGVTGSNGGTGTFTGVSGTGNP